METFPQKPRLFYVVIEASQNQKAIQVVSRLRMIKSPAQTGPRRPDLRRWSLPSSGQQPDTARPPHTARPAANLTIKPSSPALPQITPTVLPLSGEAAQPSRRSGTPAPGVQALDPTAQLLALTPKASRPKPPSLSSSGRTGQVLHVK